MNRQIVARLALLALGYVAGVQVVSAVATNELTQVSIQLADPSHIATNAVLQFTNTNTSTVVLLAIPDVVASLRAHAPKCSKECELEETELAAKLTVLMKSQRRLTFDMFTRREQDRLHYRLADLLQEGKAIVQQSDGGAAKIIRVEILRSVVGERRFYLPNGEMFFKVRDYIV